MKIALREEFVHTTTIIKAYFRLPSKLEKEAVIRSEIEK